MKSPCYATECVFPLQTYVSHALAFASDASMKLAATSGTPASLLGLSAVGGRQTVLRCSSALRVTAGPTIKNGLALAYTGHLSPELKFLEA